MVVDGFILGLSAYNGPPPARLNSLLLRTFLLAADDECNGIEHAGFIWAEPTFASQDQAGQSQQQNVSSLQISLQACDEACDPPSDTPDRRSTIRYILDRGSSS